VFERERTKPYAFDMHCVYIFLDLTLEVSKAIGPVAKNM